MAVIVATAFSGTSCSAQEHAEKESANEEMFYPHHQLALVLAHAQVFEGRDELGNRKKLSMPSWGLDYTYHFHRKWAIGLHTDIIVEKFAVKEHLEGGGRGGIIERSYPVAPALMGIYKPTSHWSFSLGMGAEFAEEENLLLTRAGAEYGAEIKNEWEVFGALSYDFKWHAYDTWTIGIGIAKSFGGRKHEKVKEER